VSVLSDLASALQTGSVEIIDLTAPLSSDTPILELPPEFGQTARFELEEISKYDDRGPAWYWNNFRSGEHTGTHFDAPNHWVSNRHGDDIASVKVTNFLRPVAVLDFSEEVAENSDFLIEVDHVRAWEAENGPVPEGGWLFFRTGWEARRSQADMINADETGPHSPGLSAACARWVAEESPAVGIGVETVGTDSGGAHSLDPAFPCHSLLLGANKFGLTQLQNLGRLPATGAMVVATPLPIVNGSGSPARVLALVEH